jgi:16S rRNA (guanine966-N2)-methyltransferase
MKLKSDKGSNTRPTSVKVRQAVMNALQSDLVDAYVLDLFAGFGAVGIEALSRGARGCVFVEQAPTALRPLRDNLAEATRRATNAHISCDFMNVVPSDVARCWDTLASRGQRFHIIWADPPYRQATDWASTLLRHVPPIAAPEGILILESGEDLPENILDGTPWKPLRSKRYGGTLVSMWQLP